MRRPDQRFVRIGETRAAKVRHRIGLAPDDVVQDPVAQILHRHADPEDVMVAADHPQGAGRLQHPARLGQPIVGEAVVGREAGKTIPFVGHGIDMAAVRPV